MTRERSILKKQLHKLAIAQADIRGASAATRLLVQLGSRASFDQFYSLNSAVVVCYGRPFSQNRPLGPLPRKWAKFSSPTLQETHDLLIRHRNQVVGHSDASERRVHISVPAISTGRTVEHSVRDIVVSPERFPIVQLLCQDLLRRLSADIETLKVSLFAFVAPGEYPLTFDDEV